MAQPKVSILISFYNLAPYVDETLQSVLNQKTDFPIEVLCADDGSADNTVEKLRQWEKRYPETVRVFVMDFIPGEKRPPDVRIKRLNAIRSRLFREAQGTYICYLDGDILLHGHTHVPACEDCGDFMYLNPGSVSIPKENSPHSYMIFEDGVFSWKNIETGEVYRTFAL